MHAEGGDEGRSHGMIEPTPIFICEREVSARPRENGIRQVKRIVQLKPGGVDGALTDCLALVR